MSKNKELELAFEFVQYTNRNIFLTGKAGTGKTTFLRSLKERSHKRAVIVAPTGVAAINAGGVTIHSFFQLPFGPIITEKIGGKRSDNSNFKQKFYKSKIRLIKTLDLLIIDEISMVRADILDAIDEVLRRYKNRFLPFGGVQLLMIGDLQQLAPVVKDDEWTILRPYYQSMFFFDSYAIKEANLVSIELKHVYRQNDDVFLNILNEIRNDKLSQESYNLLHKRYIPDFEPKEEEGYITLTTHNNYANIINEKHLRRLDNKSRFFKASIEGNFSEHSYPTDFEIELKKGAQVMFVKNDSSPEKRYYNGKIGIITSFDTDAIVVSCEGESEDIYTTPERWENIKYSIDETTKEITEEFVGSFTQYPLRLAWAITIHKSQGLTFDKAIIDAAAAFAHGQTYVALSRCKTLNGMVLSSKISENAIICDRTVNSFNKQIEENQPNENNLKEAKNAFQLDLVNELFNYKQINYNLSKLERIIAEHGSAIHGNIKENILNIKRNIIPQLDSVAKRFLQEVNNLIGIEANIEKNKKLQERITKASTYFFDNQAQKIITTIKESSFESENKNSKKIFSDALAELMESVNIKQKSLQSCIHGFSINTIMDVKAKAALDKQTKPKETNKQQEYRNVESKHPELYSMLKFWRNEEAILREVPHYIVASQKAINGIANNLPTSYAELIKINGIGKVKAAHYGEVIIELVKEYMLENGIDKEDIIEDKIETTAPPPKKKKTPKTLSHIKSLELYKSGKSIDEIASERGLVSSTIKVHLSKHIISGEVNINDMVDEKFIPLIEECIKKNPDIIDSTSELKALLPDEIDYSDIRIVRDIIKSKNIDKQENIN